MCPVCAYGGLEEPPYDEHGYESYEICPSCGTQFGYHDATRSHAELRATWVAAGAQWTSRVIPPPEGWDGLIQVRAAGLT